MELEYLVKNNKYKNINEILSLEFKISTRLKNKLIKKNMLFLNNTTCDTRAPVKVGDKLIIDFNYEEINNHFDNTVANNIDILDLNDIQLLCNQAGYNLTHSAASIGSPNWSDEKYTIDNDDLNILMIGTTYVINTTGINGYGNQGYFGYSYRYHNTFIDAGLYSENGAGIRLVVDLKANLEYYGGEGTQENPYQIY